MNETKYCQSCAMPMEDENIYGNEADGSKSSDYCKYCYVDGAFTKDETMEEMIETCVPFMVKEGAFTEEQARKIMNDTLPSLKRWAKA